MQTTSDDWSVSKEASTSNFIAPDASRTVVSLCKSKASAGKSDCFVEGFDAVDEVGVGQDLCYAIEGDAVSDTFGIASVFDADKKE